MKIITVFTLCLALTLSTVFGWSSGNSNSLLKNLLRKFQARRISSPAPTLPVTTPVTESPDCEPTEGYDEETNWCYGTFCDENGQLIYWDNFNCKPTTRLPTSTPESTPASSESEEMTARGIAGYCIYDGRLWSSGTMIGREANSAGDNCWVIYCGPRGLEINGVECQPLDEESAATTQALPPIGGK